jgi:DNA-directed RNA polymerase subunit M/transcription elongation factor TFIIS
MVMLETDSRCPTCDSSQVKLMIRTFGDGDNPVLFQRCPDCGHDLSFNSRRGQAA